MSIQPFKTLQQWLSWQEKLHPSEIELGLDRVERVLQSLLPQCYETSIAKFPFTIITVAGTNGKGSTVSMLEAILAEAGYKVGSYTSPHILQYNERIKINKEPVSDKTICDSFSRIDNARKSVSLTYFEFGTLAAIDIFYLHQCDIVVLEVGLGGRLDAVNVVGPDVALITTVDIDHQDWLGNDRNAIGLEKAGIYRKNKPAIFGDEDIPQSVIDKVKQEELKFFHYSKDYQFDVRGNQWHWSYFHNDKLVETRYNLPRPQLKGDIQLKNAANALMVLHLVREICPVSQSEIKRGLQNCHLSGRFHIHSSDPFIVLDVAHNVQAAKVLKASIEQLNVPGELHVIVGMLKDKEVKEVLSLFLPMAAHWRVIELEGPRAMPAQEIECILNKELHMDKKVECFLNFDEAYKDFARYNKQNNGFNKLLIFGSFLTVSNALSGLSGQ